MLKKKEVKNIVYQKKIVLKKKKVKDIVYPKKKT